MNKAIERAEVLIEALPYIKSFYDKTIVVKYGGSIMNNDKLKREFVKDIVLMQYVGIKPVIVHGGGKHITNLMNRLGKEAEFIDGIRKTDKETMDIIEMVLNGLINKEIVAMINHSGGRAVGISGKDANLIVAKKIQGSDGVDLGYAGEVENINPQIIKTLDRDGFIPVISPTSIGDDGITYNVNADFVAGAIGAYVKAEKVVFLTDVNGILDESGSLIPSLTLDDIDNLVGSGVIKEGMLPKIKAIRNAIMGGVKKCHIINGTVPHALLLEIFTEKGIGTEIVG